MSPLASAVVLALLPFAAAAAQKVHVPLDFPTIQMAVDAVADGGTVIVHAGSYSEPVSLVGRHAVTLRAAGKAVIETTDAPGVTIVDGSGVVVRGLRFQGGGTNPLLSITGGTGHQVQRCRFEGGTDGIAVLSSEAFVVERNRFTDLSGTAIRAGSGADCTGAASQLRRNSIGAAVFSLAGIVVESGAVIVECNRLTGRVARAIEVRQGACSVVLSRNRVVEGESSIGVGFMIDAPGTVLQRNTIRAYEGIRLLEGAAGSVLTRNRIEHRGGGGVWIYADQVSVSKSTALAFPGGGAAFAVSGFSTGSQLIACRGNGEYAFFLYGHDGLLTGCVAGKSVVGFTVGGTGNTLDSCRATKSYEHGLVDSSGGATNVYQDCHFKSVEVK